MLSDISLWQLISSNRKICTNYLLYLSQKELIVPSSFSKDISHLIYSYTVTSNFFKCDLIKNMLFYIPKFLWEFMSIGYVTVKTMLLPWSSYLFFQQCCCHEQHCYTLRYLVFVNIYVLYSYLHSTGYSLFIMYH